MIGHEIRVLREDDERRTWECECGWLTIETIDPPDYHTPIEERKAEHLREAAAIDDGSVWNELPYGHRLVLFLRRRLSNGERNHVVLWAMWADGFREVANWPWDNEGLDWAQRFCDGQRRKGRPVTWMRSGFEVEPRELAAFYPSRWDGLR